MARIRTIKPEFWKHEILSSLPEATHVLAAALLNYADDEGYFNANPGLIKAECSPLREPSVSIHDSLISLSKIGYLRFGTGPDGRRYGRVVSFDDHQRINRPTPSKIKELDIVWEDSPTTHPQLTEGSHPEGKGKEQGKEQGKRERFTLPDWIDPILWKSFEDMRQRLRKPMTDDGRRLAVKKLESLRAQGHSPQAVIENSVMNSYQGFFPPSGHDKPGVAPIKREYVA
jgi:hypothetical protein